MERDPGTLLLSLIEGARLCKPGFGAHTLARMKGEPGPVFGWAALYHSLAEEFNAELPEGSITILENVHTLIQNIPVLQLLNQEFVGKLSEKTSLIQVSHRSLPDNLLPPKMFTIGSQDLRLELVDWQSLSQEITPEAIQFPYQHIHHFINGKEEVIRGILEACRDLGEDCVFKILEKSRSTDQLMEGLAKGFLTTAEPKNIQAITLTRQIGYSHPHLITEAVGGNAHPGGPWLQVLEDKWMRLREVWEAPLANILGRRMIAPRSQVHRAAIFLAGRQGKCEAISILLRIADFQHAAHDLCQVSEAMLNYGQWQTLNEWINRLPAEVLNAWPDLVYASGEMAVAWGQTKQARRKFQLSAHLYSHQKNPEGLCKSMVEESILAAWDGDFGASLQSIRRAQIIARKEKLAALAGWTAWQSGCRNLTSGDYEAALEDFNEAVKSVSDRRLLALIEHLQSLARQQDELRKKTTNLYQAYLEAKQEEQLTAAQIQSMTNFPPENLSEFLINYGWAKIPLSLKLPESADQSRQNFNENQYLLRRLLKKFPFHHQQSVLKIEKATKKFAYEGSEPAKAGDSYLGWGLPGNGLADYSQLPTKKDLPDEDMNLDPTSSLETYPALQGINASDSAQGEMKNQPESGLFQEEGGIEIEQSSFLLKACLLGDFNVSLNGQPLVKPPGSRSVAVLKYLLIQSRREVPREVLMDVFWPDSDPKSARNNLNVALHKLRQAFIAITEQPVIVFELENYFFNPALNIFTDIEEFEGLSRSGRNFEKAGSWQAAVASYESACKLYQGDLLADEPYAEWAINRRERLRVEYLEILDRLGRIYFNQEEYEHCSSLCQKILGYDNCREDIHCLLMRCFGRQDKFNLSLRQYQLCAESLRKELDVEPANATRQLYERMRRREHTRPLRQST